MKSKSSLLSYEKNPAHFNLARNLLLPVLAGILALSYGCSTPNPTQEYISAIEQNRPLDSDALYKKQLEEKGLTQELYLMEKARITQIQGDFDSSRACFDEEVEILKQRELDDDTLPGVEINTGSVLVNDNMLPYKARLFEVEMLYLMQSFNYLSKGDLEGATVEIRNADYLLNEAEKARENENFKEECFRSSEAGIQKKLFENQKALQKNPTPEQPADEKKVETPPEKPATENKTETSEATPEETPAQKKADEQKRAEYEQKSMTEYEKNFAGMEEALAQSKSSVLNPYVLYMSGIVHEMNGEFDDAYISYKKGLELMPSNPYLQRDVVRLARKLNKTNDFDNLKSSYPELWKQFSAKTPSGGKDGRLIVLYEYGWAPKKTEVFISLGAIAFAYPVYKFKWSLATPMQVSSELGEIGPTSPICYMNAIALRALKEEAKWRIIRQAARATVKGAVFAAGTTMTAASSNSGVQLAGVGIMVASAIYNNVSENADLRCFMTLPENVQILSSSIPEGKHKISFAPQGTQLRMEETVPVIAGKTTIVRVIQVGPRLIYQRLWPAPEPTDILNKSQEGNNP